MRGAPSVGSWTLTRVRRRGARRRGGVDANASCESACKGMAVGAYAYAPLPLPGPCELRCLSGTEGESRRRRL